jgi:uncharacterized damage-inducible protein DinB
VTRVEPPDQGSENEQLLAFLDYHRATLETKCAGLDAEQLRATVGVSTMTLGGMLKHVALNEDSWFGEVLRGEDQLEPWASVDWDADRDWDWHSAVDDSPEELRALWEAACERSRERLAGVDLDAPAVKLHHGKERFNGRWIVLHMIEEYARHNGHADLIRESIDGATGE